MAKQMMDRLENLYAAASQRDGSPMHSNAVSACSRWCGSTTSHAELAEFVARQVASLEGLNDSLSVEIRGSWEWLAGEIGTAPAAVVAPQEARIFRFASRRQAVSVGTGIDHGLQIAA